MMHQRNHIAARLYGFVFCLSIVACVALGACNEAFSASATIRSLEKTNPLDDYRYPDESDYLGDWKEYRATIPIPFHISADFNGDKLNDDAWILIKSTGPGWGLFVFLSQQRGGQTVICLDESSRGSPCNMGISIVEPGQYTTAAGKGYWPVDAENPAQITLRRPAINFFAYESANSFFYWNEVSQSFSRIWMSD